MKNSHKLRIAIYSAAVWAISAVCLAAINGPRTVETGHLAVFSSDYEGDFTVYPNAADCFAKDSNGKTLYFASPKTGNRTLIFFGIQDGKPVIETLDFIVGVPEPSPTPSPEPSPANNFSLTAAEKAAVSKAMKAVCEGIANNTIRTPQTARATFKSNVFQATKSCQNGTCSVPANVNKALVEIEKSIDLTTLEGIKSGFEQVVKELEK